MLPELQQQVNNRITPALYTQLREYMDHWLNTKIQYRVAEMPIMVSNEFARQMGEASVSIIKECVGNSSDYPLFSVVDFAVCQDPAGAYVPKLIELQGFPSLFGYQLLLCNSYQQTYGFSEGTPFIGNHSYDSYLELLRECIYADADPQRCVLLEVDPFSQKTLPDFLALRKYIGLEIVNIRDVKKVGRTLQAPIGGVMVTLERAFNRTIVDELDDLGYTPDFAWDDDLDITWAGRPDWYFKISKQSMIGLTHSSVPTTKLLSDFGDLPADLGRYVLKPLYAFAGKGVVVGPTLADIDSISESNRHHWILQERIDYADCVPTPLGNNRVEIRIMLVWPEGATEPQPVMSLARTGRGLMMGARYNTDQWTGSSGCLFY